MNSRVEKTLIICAGVTLAFSIARAGTQWQVAWQRSFGGTNTDNLTSLQGTSDGGYVLGGTSNSGATGNKTSAKYGDYDYWVIKLNAAGDKVWENVFGGTNTDNLNSIQQANDGGYVLGGISFSGISGNKTNTRRLMVLMPCIRTAREDISWREPQCPEFQATKPVLIMV